MKVCPTSPLTHPHACTGPAKLSNFPLAQQPFSACHLLCWQDPPEEHQQQGRNWNVMLWIFIPFPLSQLGFSISQRLTLPPSTSPEQLWGADGGEVLKSKLTTYKRPKSPVKTSPRSGWGVGVSVTHTDHCYWHRFLRTFALGRVLYWNTTFLDPFILNLFIVECFFPSC